MDELDQSARAIAEKRSRVQEFAAAQRQELDRLDAEITGQLERIREELRREHVGAADHRDELAEQAEQVRRQTEELRARSESLAVAEADLRARRKQFDDEQEQAGREQAARTQQFDHQRAELDDRDRQLQERSAAQTQHIQAREAELEQLRLQLESVEAKLRHDGRELEARSREHQADVEETARARQRAEDRLATLEQERAELEAERTRTKAQRDRIAQQLKQQRDDQWQEIERRREEVEALAKGERSDLEQALSAAQHERQQIEVQLREHGERLTAEIGARELAQEDLARSQKEVDRLARDLAEVREQGQGVQSRLAAATARVAELEAERAALVQSAQEAKDHLATAGAADARSRELEARCQSLEAELAQSHQREARAAQSNAPQLEQALRERETLVAQLADAQSRLADAERRLAEGPAAPAELAELADLKRRHEMLMDDLRELKKRNAELEKKASAAGHVAAAHSGAMDWEAQKLRMLAALEADQEQEDDARKAERLKIDETIRTTDAAIADKNREIEELQRLLAHQSENLGSVAVGAAAFGEMLDKDEIVRQERERLKQLQGEWEEKLRQAEVELSVQRAQIARARVELDERQRAIESEAAQRGGDRENAGAETKSKKPPQRGRWLSRLGLKDDGE